MQARGSGGAEFRDRLFALGARGFGALELVGHRLPRGGGAQIAVADLPQCRFRSLGAALGGLCQIEFAGGGHRRGPFVVSRPYRRSGGEVRGATASANRSEEHTSELQSLMRISYAVFCLKKKKKKQIHIQHYTQH